MKPPKDEVEPNPISGPNKQSLDPMHGSLGRITYFPAWPAARNTAFIGYIYNEVYTVDLFKLQQDSEWLDLCIKLLEEIPVGNCRIVSPRFLREHFVFQVIRVLRIIDTAEIASRNHIRARKLIAKNSKGAPQGMEEKAHFGKAAPVRIHQAKRFEVEKKFLQSLPPVFVKHSETLVHIEFKGVSFYDWTPISNGLQNCTCLKRLYLRGCNLGDHGLKQLCKIVQTLAVNHLAVADCDLTSTAVGHVSNLLKFHQHQRSELKWQLGLRGAPVPSIANLHDFGLLCLDISSNELGDEGVAEMARTLAAGKYAQLCYACISLHVS